VFWIAWAPAGDVTPSRIAVAGQDATRVNRRKTGNDAHTLERIAIAFSSISAGEHFITHPLRRCRPFAIELSSRLDCRLEVHRKACKTGKSMMNKAPPLTHAQHV
jgi:hypothetical protein